MLRIDKSGPRAPYFLDLQRALHRSDVTEPVLVVDKTRLLRNIYQLAKDLPRGMALRMVAKSLPVPEILKMVQSRLKTHAYMTFNRRMLEDVSAMDPLADQLLGKPLPVKAAARYLSDHGGPVDQARTHWLIDTEQRFEQYLELAVSRDITLDIALELDVGLHRGGFSVGSELNRVMQKCVASPHLRMSGLMGYDAHVAKAPKALGLRRRAHDFAVRSYRKALETAEPIAGGPMQIRNAAGSPTFKLYRDTSLVNEVAVGSVLLKPTDFDTDLLADYVPALFVATPAIKVSGQMQTPVLEALDPLKRWFNPNLATSLFIHGGYWKARPVDPPGLNYNATYGRSSNQEVLNGGVRTEIQADDFVFLRPSQSEAVLLQFGKIAVYDDGEITESWAPFGTSV